MNADKILALLANKHFDDVFVPECKDGPTHDQSHRRLDAWAMAKSWRHPLVTGYEIKVTRSDFLNDNKWQDYLPMCNCLYFACPWGLIDPREVPDNVGLIWVSKTGTRLYTKRKALYRDVEIPDSIFRYILMCRTHISKERQINKPARAVVWEEWLRRKLEYKNLGYRVGNRVREHVTKVRDENLALIEENKEYSAIRDRLTELGIDTEKPVYEWSFFNQLQETMSGIPQGLEYALKQAHRATGDAIERVESCRSITEKGE